MTDDEPQLRAQHPSDKYGTKLVDKAGALQEKAQTLVGKDSSDQKPAGGYDATAVPEAPPGYTVRITFHRAEHLPFTDFPSFSTDAYIHATFRTSLLKRHKQDPDIFLRTPTIHRNTNPRWETQWVIAHVPASGFLLKCRLFDEDPNDHDDRLGNVHVNVHDISEDWQGIKEQPYDLKKRMGSKRAYTFRGVAHLLKNVKMSAHLYISVEVLGRSPGESGGRSFTVAPLSWTRHQSPLIGRITGTKDRQESNDGKKSVERYNFQAVQMQLRGPVPAPMYHRYVEFKPFVAGMFTDVSFRGRILNRALHHQHSRVYNYDASTVYGIFEKPCIEMTKQLLEFCHYDLGGRIYTYVLSLDGLWRFTETGKEFGIDLLSKHTMHSDVSIYIAFSGEFFIRRLKHPHRETRRSRGGSSETHHDPVGNVEPPAEDPEDEDAHKDQHSHQQVPKDPSYYELIIDNDSGTYRPNADFLPLLKQYMSQNFPGLRVATLDCQKDEEEMQKLKNQQRDRKKHSGKQITYLQNSSMSSLSSSDVEELDARAEGHERPHGYKRQMAKLQQDHKTTDGIVSNSTTLESGHSHANGAPAPDRDLPSEHDSRDFNSSISHASFEPPHQSRNQREEGVENGRSWKDGYYTNKELPTLLRTDENGQMLRPQELANSQKGMNESDGGAYKSPSGTTYGEPETGKHRPAGGIVYGKIFSTAGVEKGCPLGMGEKDHSEDKKEKS
ncbi:hypothetical protein LTR70_008044 [Exophiala xenobiotica]|uniref:C2 domain-containing protein n=1 Tax=Lithohypha guttulata TaxID=1690604 RepID=A0ABR0K2J4_9EURO|nr:hypothetical protein LTR24_007580 [Lithohypha guttulata]KAK5312674.1 hypothetical protein LTR70_008044 [Exophiala xenobiotica]